MTEKKAGPVEQESIQKQSQLNKEMILTKKRDLIGIVVYQFGTTVFFYEGKKIIRSLHESSK